MMPVTTIFVGAVLLLLGIAGHLARRHELLKHDEYLNRQRGREKT